MDLTFENHYVVGITVFMLAMLFCKNLLETMQSFVQCWQQCCMACLDAWACPCAHYGHKEMVRVVVMAAVYTFSVGQPFMMILARYIGTSTEYKPLWTVNVITVVWNASAFEHQHNSTNAQHSKHPSLVDVKVTETDVLLLVMPFALCAAVSTWTWLSLHHAGFFSNDPLWDAELFRDARMQLYELAYVLEQWLLTLALATLAAEPADFWYVLCFSVTCVLITCYLLACSRTALDTEGVNMPILAFALLCTALSVFVSRHWTQCVHQNLSAVALMLQGLILGFMHLSARGEASAGSVILGRTSISCVFSLYFIINLGIGANRFCV